MDGRMDGRMDERMDGWMNRGEQEENLFELLSRPLRKTLTNIWIL